MKNKHKNSKTEILVRENELPLSCPSKQTWDGHPKIYLDILEKKTITCPYCGQRYKLVQKIF